MADNPQSPKSPAPASPVTLNIGQVVGTVIGSVSGVVHGPVFGAPPSPAAAPPSGSFAVQAPFSSEPSTPSTTSFSPDLAPSPSVPLAIHADVVYLSASADEPHRQTLVLHLAPALDRLGLTDWHLRDTPLGAAPAAALVSALKSARVAFLLVSPDYLVDALCRAGERLALSLAPAGLRVIPLSLRPIADWPSEPFGHLASLPQDNLGKPVSSWPSAEDAWVHIARHAIALLGGQSPPK